MKTQVYSLFILLLLVNVSRLQAGESSAQLYNNEGFFGTHDILELKIQADLDFIFNDTSVNPDYSEGVLIHDGSIYNVKLKPRGNFRRENCKMPPIKLNFRKKEVIGTEFNGVDKIKMVTECFANREKFNDIINQEYMVYRLYNILTPYSFRVRMARIEFVDISGKIEPYTSWSFFIEDDDEMARRLDMNKMEHQNIHQEHTDRHMITLLSVFNYLIGNTDWSVSNLHNIELLQKRPHDLPIAVPYDFDWADFVNAPYATAHKTIDPQKEEEKKYRGYTRTDEELEKVFDIFRDNREEIYMLYEEYPYLSDKGKKMVRKELDDFYHTIETPRLANTVFVENSRS